MLIAHLTSSTFFGGPERQMLGLAQSLPEDYRSVFFSFREGGRCQAFLQEARRIGFEAAGLEYDTPRLLAARRALIGQLKRLQADILLCHGYKADLIGRKAARQAGIPVVAVSRGWTWESLKVRLYEALDRRLLRFMDRVVCVSEAQAVRVRRVGVPHERILVIHNAIQPDRFEAPDPAYRHQLDAYLPEREPAPNRQTAPEDRKRLILAAGRLSPEKGFGVLVQAARHLIDADPGIRVILFGDGLLRDALLRQVADAGLAGRFVLAGFRADLDCLLPFADVVVQSSFTEGLPNLVLEACAAGVPVVATAVGGTPEIIEDGASGYLVAPGDSAALARQIRDILDSEEKRQAMGRRGRQRVIEHFSFARQALSYQRLFKSLVSRSANYADPDKVCDGLAQVEDSGQSTRHAATSGGRNTSLHHGWDQ
jgi:glycosyltransferase involved in cell wall biosynthesis